MNSRLKHLHLKNFKSFKNAKIPLKNGLTIIVGSNGSGKTNVADALLFAIGTTSLKMLRASKLTDLINHNSVENYGKVELTLKGGEKTWTISRLIDNKGKSIYRLNSDRKSLNEIESFLNELGIRNDGHNIVAQGDVTKVIEKNALERRYIIDEIAGIQEFDEKKQEAEKELSKVDEKIKDTRIVLNERSAYLQKLEEEKNAALEFEHLENRKKSIKATIIFKEIEQARESKKEDAKKLSDIEKKIKENEELTQKFSGEEDSLRKEIEEINSFILSENQRIYSEIASKLEGKRSKNVVLKEKIDYSNAIIKRNAVRKQELTEKLSDLKKEKSSLQERIEQITHKLNVLNEKLSAKKAEKEKIAVGKEDSSAKVAEINEKYSSLEKEIDSLQMQLHNKRVELHSLQKQNTICKDHASDLEKEISLLQKKLFALEKKSRLLNSLHFKLANPCEELKRLEERFSSALEEEKKQQATISHLQDSLKQLESAEAKCHICDSTLDKEKKMHLLEKKKASLKHEESSYAVLLEKTSSLRKRIEEVKKLAEEEQNLLHELKDFDASKGHLKELQTRLANEKDSIKNTSSLEEELAKLGSELKKLFSKKKGMLKDIEKTQVGFIDKEFERLTNDLSELLNEKNALLQEKNSSEKILIPKIDAELASVEQELSAMEKENSSLKENLTALEKNIETQNRQIAVLEKKVEKEKLLSEKKLKQKDLLNEKLSNLKEKQDSLKQKLLQLSSQKTQLQVSNNTIGIRINDLQEELKEFEGVKKIHDKSLKELKEEFPNIEKRVSKLGTINLKAIESCAELNAELKDVKEKVEKLEQERQAVLDLMEKIEVKRKNVFMECFNKINENFSKMFFQLFEGEGSLKLTNPEEPFSSGLIIEAQHKGKGLQRIDAMSGGEKSLTALAFLFAIQLYEPAPFYIFDEADAALDKENSIKLVKIIKRMCTQSQFIMISHNDEIIKKADQIIGVTLNQDKSSVIGLDLRV